MSLHSKNALYAIRLVLRDLPIAHTRAGTVPPCNGQNLVTRRDYQTQGSGGVELSWRAKLAQLELEELEEEEKRNADLTQPSTSITPNYSATSTDFLEGTNNNEELDSYKRIEASLIVRKLRKKQWNHWSIYDQKNAEKLNFVPNPVTPAPAPFDFLEAFDDIEEKEEYKAVEANLDRRRPLIFKQASPVVNEETPEFPAICDVVHRTVLRGDYTEARRLYKELLDYGHHLKPQKAYFRPAIKCLLESSDPEGFILWLQACSGRPALRTNPQWKAQWAPVISCLKTQHTNDVDLISEFMVLSGKLGIAPVTFPALIPHFTLIATPERSFETMKRASDHFDQTNREHTRSAGLHSFAHDNALESQLKLWWDLYTRRLVVAGWNAMAVEAADYYNRTYNKSGYRGQTEVLLKSAEQLVAEGRTKPAAKDMMYRLPKYVKTDGQSIAKRIRVSLRTSITHRELAHLISEIQREYSETHPTLLASLERRFTSTRRAAQLANPQPVYSTEGQWDALRKYRLRTWQMAQISILQDKGDHANAVKYFDEHFLWIGLPDHPLRHVDPESDQDALKIPPTRRAIDQILRSLVLTLPQIEHDIMGFHDAFLKESQRLPPALQPDIRTHAHFVKDIVYHRNPRSGLGAIQNTVKHGFDPGEVAYSKVLFGYVRMKKIRHASRLWRDMESGAPIPNTPGARTPKPSDRTRRRFEAMLKQTVQMAETENIQSEMDAEAVSRLAEEWEDEDINSEDIDEEDLRLARGEYARDYVVKKTRSGNLVRHQKRYKVGHMTMRDRMRAEAGEVTDRGQESGRAQVQLRQGILSRSNLSSVTERVHLS